MALCISVRSAAAGSPPLVFDQPLIVIGRSASSDVRLPDPSVSQRHATVRQRGRDYIVLDEGSTNGTFVGPVQLARGSPRVLRPGDLIRVGRVWLEVDIDPAAAPSTIQSTKELALRLVSGALSADGAPAVPFVSTEDGDRRLELKEFHHAYVIGRSPRCDLPLQDDDCSRRHVEVERVGSDVMVRDLGSKNGSELDGQRVVDEQRWLPGQVLHVGQSRLLLSDPLHEVLRELESSQDEVVTDDVAPPDEDVDEPGEPDRPQKRGKSAAAEPGAAPGGVAIRPEAELAAPARRRASWGTVDVLVAVFALAVLGVSVAGLLWLMRS